MKTYDVVAKCKSTSNCEGTPSFGTVTAESLEALNEQLLKLPPRQATCPICKKTATYSFPDYRASPLGEHSTRSLALTTHKTNLLIPRIS